MTAPLDLFATGKHAPPLPRLTRAARRRRNRQARETMERLAAAERERLTPRQREERLHELFQQRVYAAPVDLFAWLDVPKQADLRAGILERLALGESVTPAPRLTLRERQDARPDAAERWLVALLRAAAAGAIAAPSSPLESPDGAAHDDYRLATRDEATKRAEAGPGLGAARAAFPHTPLGSTRVEFHQAGNVLDVRRLRALVRNAVRPLFGRNTNLRKCGERRFRLGVEARVKERRGSELERRGVVAGVVRCGSVHSCVKCAPRISAVRAEQVEAIAKAHREQTATPDRPEGGLYLATFTVPHDVGMRLKRLRRTVSRAWQGMQRGKGWKLLRARMGFVGSITGREVTHGAAGWHPHVHVLFALRRPLTDAERLDVEQLLFERWCAALRAIAGVRSKLPTREHGVTFRTSYQGDYIAKLGLADELTRGATKEARGANRTPFAIMADYARDRAPQDRALLREYIPGMRGARQLTWSRGRAGETDLRRIYAAALAALDPVGQESLTGFESETELLERLDQEGTVVGTLAGRQWDALVTVMRAARSDAENELISAIETDGARGLEALLGQAGAIARRLIAATRRGSSAWATRRKARLRAALRWLPSLELSECKRMLPIC